MLRVKKRNGRLDELKLEKINKCAARACEGLEDVSPSELVLSAQLKLFDKIKTEDIDKALIEAAKEKVLNEPNWSYVAGRILLSCVYKEVLKESVDSDTFENDYRSAFVKNIKKGVKAGYFDPRLLDFDLKFLASKLNIVNDYKFKYLGVKALSDRYLFKLDGKTLETPQSLFMRIAMGLSFSESNKEEFAIKLYNVYSNLEGMPATPTLLNSGKVVSQTASCFTGDNLVETLAGKVKIKDIKTGDQVLTSKGRYRTVLGTREMESDKDLAEVSLRGLFHKDVNFESTVDHPILALRFKEGEMCEIGESLAPKPKFIPAGELTTDDFVAVSFPSEEKYFEYSISDEISELYVHEIEVFDGMLCRDKVALDKKFGLWLGYYLSEGHINQDRTIVFTFGSHEKEYIQECKDLCYEIFGIEATTKENVDNSTNIFLNSVFVALFVKKIVGTGFDKKFLSQELVFAPIDFCKALLMGACRGDGGRVSENGFALSLSNEGLIWQIFNMSLKCGLLPLISKPFMSSLATTQPYSLTYNTTLDLEFVKSLEKGGNFSKPKAGQRVNRFFLEDMAYYRVNSIVTKKNKSLVYDLQVEEDETFCVNGAVAHNCYLNTFDDSLDGIFLGAHQEARKSKWAGGLGLDVSNFRATGAAIKGTNGKSSGLIPWLKVFESVVTSVDQGGTRKGSACAYLEPWHLDFEDFIKLRKGSGDEWKRTHNLNTAAWMPDEFFKRLDADEDWYFFDPSECPELHHVYGNEFKKAYAQRIEQAEAGLIKFSKCRTKDLWKEHLRMLFETGHPWITFKDPCNLRYPNKHNGKIYSSNLCVAPETLLLTKEGHIPIASLEGKNVEVWNGKQWSKTVPRKTGERQKLLTVNLSDGKSLDCTEYHKWYLAGSYDDVRKGIEFKRETKDLKVGDKLVKFDLPVIDGNEEFPHPYTHGAFCGDGTVEGPNREPRRQASRFVKVESIVCNDRISDTYCVNEPLEHKAVFNGILTGNCTETVLETKHSEYDEMGKKTKNGETAVCQLSSLCLPVYFENGELNHDKLRDKIITLIRALDNAIDLGFYPTEECNAHLEHRPVGLGVMGFHDVCHLLDIVYDSDEGVELARSLQEAISLYCIEASTILAEERGRYSTYDGSLWDQGILPHDSYFRSCSERDLKPILSKKEVETLDGWSDVRKQIEKHGMRNSNVMVIQPTASVSYIAGYEQSIEPNYRISYTYSNLSGVNYVINALSYFKKDMQKEGLWDLQLVAALNQQSGDPTNLSIPEKYKKKYATVFQRDFYKLIKCAAVRQIYIDQAQSFNIYYNGSSLKEINDFYRTAWRSGLKTTYYFRNEKKTEVRKLEPKVEETESKEEPLVCVMDEGCVSCQ